MSMSLVPRDTTEISCMLDEFLSASSDDKKIDAVQAMLMVINNHGMDNPEKDMSAMYELACYKYAGILDAFHVSREENKAKIGMINQFIEKYLRKAGYDVDKMFDR